MTDVAQSPTVEINDAVFCLTHFKEVVRSILSFLPAIPPSLPTLIISILLLLVCVSAAIATLICGRRTTDSSGYVSYHG
jgi:hypothetical protein